MHRAILDCMGERLEPLRDEGLLESALMRAQMAAYYDSADLVTQAVLMAVGISQNQPFVDGNKRAALVTLDVFLRVNGLEFRGDSRAGSTHRTDRQGPGSTAPKQPRFRALVASEG
ncbi:MAG: Fic family protein [Thermomicrobiales bacterium]